MPGRVNNIALYSMRPGIYFGQCREICGRNHSFIPIALEVYFNLLSNLKLEKTAVKILVQLLFVMISVAFFTLMERKLLGSLHLRVGPNKPGLAGSLVPFSDAIKLIKECNIPRTSNMFLFAGVPLFSLGIPSLLWAMFPSPFKYLSFKYAALFFLAVSSLGVFALLGAGWSRNRKYTLLGRIRAVAQRVSYEVVLSIILLHSFLFYYYALIKEKLCPIVFL